MVFFNLRKNKIGRFMSQKSEIRSNLAQWKEMQEQEYFEKHPCYCGLVDKGEWEIGIIEQFSRLTSDLNVVVIGCGYGRESVPIARRVKCVYGIDVSDTILTKAVDYVKKNSISNFIPVLAEDYKTKIPDGIDLVFSIVVMQHLSRDLVRDYMRSLGTKLTPTGKMVIQFLEELGTDPDADAELRVYEPSVSWTLPRLLELAQFAGLNLREIRSNLATPTAFWHWAFFERQP
jgi:cyclopropane fatty-acyl-phospholipid synthase-like methyltransferase